jgi:hypothetical protein
MFQTKTVDEIKTDILLSIIFFRKSCRLWGNVKYIVLRVGSQITIWRMRIARWIPRATHTHTHTLRICYSYCFSTATMVYEHALVLSYTCIARLV